MEETIKKFEKMLKEGKDCRFNKETYEHIIDCYFRKGKSDISYLAIKSYNKQYPNSTELLWVEGAILYKLKCYKEAIEMLNKAEFFNPKKRDIYYYRSLCFCEIKEFGKANEDDIKYLMLDTKRWEAAENKRPDFYKNLKRKMIEMKPLELLDELIKEHGTEEKAFTIISIYFDFIFVKNQTFFIDFSKALIEDSPSSAIRWLLLGTSYNSVDRYTEAIEAITTSISLDPNNSKAHYTLGKVYQNLKNYKEAISSCLLAIQHYFPSEKDVLSEKDEIIQSQKLADIYYDAGEFYMELMQYKNAEKALKYSIEYYPYNDICNGNLGISLLKQKKYKEAIKYLREAIVINGDTFDFFYAELAYSYFKTGDIKKAESTLNKLDDRTYLYNNNRVYIFLFYWETGNQKVALKKLEEGIAENPFLTGLYYLKASYFYRMNDKGKGNKALIIALKCDKNKYDLLFEYAPELAGNKEILKVIEDFKIANNKGKLQV